MGFGSLGPESWTGVRVILSALLGLRVEIQGCRQGLYIFERFSLQVFVFSLCLTCWVYKYVYGLVLFAECSHTYVYNVCIYINMYVYIYMHIWLCIYTSDFEFN